MAHDGSSRRYRRRANAERNWQVILRAAIIGAYCVVLLIAGLYLGYRGRERPEPVPTSLSGAPEDQDPEGLADSVTTPGGPEIASQSWATATAPAEQDPDKTIAPAEPVFDESVTGSETSGTGATQSQGTGQDQPAWPVEGDVVGEARWVFSDYLGEWRYLPGVEISVNPGTPVTAAMSGTVTSVCSDPDLGTLVTLEHPDGTTTEYGRLSGCILGVGDIVKQGEEIGRTGGTTLYFGTSVNDEAVPVTEYMKP